jgi:predicted type IV restriction endonuclease
MAVEITKDLKRYIPIFQQAHDQGINEAETSLRNVDYAIKLSGKVRFFIEVKQACLSLKEKHIEQAENYAANAGIPWVLLTSGCQWQLYHLTFDDGIQSDLIWSVDILADELKAAAEKLTLLHKKSIVKGELEDYYAKFKTLTPRSIVQAVFHENTLRMIRACLKNSTGVRVDEQELADNIKKMISQETWEVIGDVKIIRKRKAAKPKPKEEAPAPQPAPAQAKQKIG